MFFPLFIYFTFLLCPYFRGSRCYALVLKEEGSLLLVHPSVFGTGWQIQIRNPSFLLPYDCFGTILPRTLRTYPRRSRATRDRSRHPHNYSLIIIFMDSCFLGHFCSRTSNIRIT
jgi:hypothetical protein